MPALTILFVTSSSVVVAYVAVRAYLRVRFLQVLFLGCGATIFGCTSLVAVLFVGSGGLDFALTVFSIGALISALFHLSCALLTYLRGTPRPHRSYHAALWMSVALLSVVSILVAALDGVLPAFYAAKVGTTFLGEVVLDAASAVFALSAVAVFAVYGSSKSRVLFWYSLALAATAVGLVGVSLSSGDVGAETMWAGWAAFYFGGIFLVKSVLSAERLAAIPTADRKLLA